MKIVAALGGNALLERGEAPDSDIQEAHVARAVEALVPVARQHELVLTHGNGPQVGLLAMESARDPSLTRPYPLDLLGAQTQGMIGYWLVQALQNADVGRPVACLISRTLVSAEDPAFSRPTKFVGPIYSEAQARELAAARGWQVRPDGPAWRRVVPSPEPVELLDLPMISLLVGSGTIVVSAGFLHGAEAVIDKDLTAALLARALDADVLLLLTDVDAVQDGYGTPQARPIHHITPSELRSRTCPDGSMGPKVEAVCRFVAATGKMAVIGRLADAEAMAEGKAGTVIKA